ncbi:MAG: hypothetical protein FRX49_05665 [Trebouxia sp. A1-2]|nr:MAG: hypothetical protein FRX49_05665 [Trebouxia sp. A1-2]
MMSGGVLTASSQADQRSSPSPVSESVRARVAALHASTRQRLLSNAGIDPAGPWHEQPVRDTDWGFANRLPDLKQLLQDFASQSTDAASKNASTATAYLAALYESRIFNCPDCVDAMAEAYGVTSAVNQLRGSALDSQLDSESQQTTEDSRQFLKAQLKLGWSSEAVKQGVVHAKKGEYDAALGCYKKALDLDRRNVDAWVARGAAYANQRAFPRAVSDFQTALEIEPGHVNASKYLRVTEQHMTQLGLPIAASLQQPVLVDNIRAHIGHHQAAEQDAPVQPAAAQIDLTATGMSEPVKVPTVSHHERAQAATQADSSEPASSSGIDVSQQDMDLQKALQIKESQSSF